MNLLTALIFFFGILVPEYSVSQRYTPASFFWNQYIHTNPAMTGAVYKHQVNVQTKLKMGWTKYDNHPTDLWVNYAMRLDSIHSGIGVSYAGNLIDGGLQHVALVSYAYHIPFKRMTLSLGISAGMNTLEPYSNKENSRTLFQGDFGIALHGERWNFGISSTRLTGYISIAGERDPDMTPLYWLFGEYKIRLSKNWNLTPRSQVGTSLIDLEDLHGVFALTADIKNFWFGPSISCYLGSELQGGFMLGYDIKSKFRIAYTYEFGFTLIGNTQFMGSRAHELILSYQLK